VVEGYQDAHPFRYTSSTRGWSSLPRVEREWLHRSSSEVCISFALSSSLTSVRCQSSRFPARVCPHDLSQPEKGWPQIGWRVRFWPNRSCILPYPGVLHFRTLLTFPRPRCPFPPPVPFISSTLHRRAEHRPKYLYVPPLPFLFSITNDPTVFFVVVLPLVVFIHLGTLA
jgi:hypothetical protein